MPPPVGRNWEIFLEEQVRHGPNELDLRTLRPGDQLVVVTKNTRYEFDWLEGGGVLLRSNRSDRPWGQVSLTGCLFRRSGVLAPNVVFRGGKLEFLTMDGQVKHQTTAISEYKLLRPSSSVSAQETHLSTTLR